MTEGVQLPVSDPVGKRFTDRGAVGMETLKARQLRREVSGGSVDNGESVQLPRLVKSLPMLKA